MSVSQSFAVPIQLYKYGISSVRAITGALLVASSLLDIVEEHRKIQLVDKLFKQGDYKSLMHGLYALKHGQYGIIKYAEIDAAMAKEVDCKCRLAIPEEEDKALYVAKCTEWRAKELAKMREKLCAQEVVPALKKQLKEINVAGRPLPKIPVKLGFLLVGALQIQKGIFQR